MIETKTRIIPHRNYQENPYIRAYSSTPIRESKEKENIVSGNERVTYVKHTPAKVYKETDDDEGEVIEPAQVITLAPRISKGRALSMRTPFRESITPVRYPDNATARYYPDNDYGDVIYKEYPNIGNKYGDVLYKETPQYVYEDEQPRYVYEDQQPRYVYEDQQPRYVYQDQQPRYVYEDEPQYAYEEQPRYVYEEEQPRYVYEDEQPRYVYQDQQPRYVYEDEQPRYVYEDEQPRYAYEPQYVYENKQPTYVYERPESMTYEYEPSSYVTERRPAYSRMKTPNFNNPSYSTGSERNGKEQFRLTSTVYIRPLDKVPENAEYISR